MARAIAFTRTASRGTTQDKAFALLALGEGGVPRGDPDHVTVLSDLLDDQHPDGGWSERPGLASNAYATGQALYALLEAGESVDLPSICSGIGWLTDHQNPDGSWSLGTPGIETDSSRNSFFTATIWPVLALGSLRPWGADVVVPSSDIVSCADEIVFELEVRHAADTACGLFAERDTYDLSVFNDRGDTVVVSPPALTLQSGERATVTVTWTRYGPQPSAGTVSTTTLMLRSQGAAAAGCPEQEQSRLTVTVPDDPPPTAMGFGLRATKNGPDLALKWSPHPDRIDGVEVVRVGCSDRASCAADPTRQEMDLITAFQSLGPNALSANLPGELLPGADPLVFYKTRVFTSCLDLRGPTCNFPCSDLRGCYATCP